MSRPFLYPRHLPRAQAWLRRGLITTPSPPPFPTTPSCPPSTCACAPTPSFPPGFEIDHAKPLNGTMPAYSEQVLICTGRDDWESRIEDEEDGKNLAARIKRMMGREGAYFDPYNNVSVLNSSFDSSSPGNSAFILPSFKYVPLLNGELRPNSITSLIKGYLLPTKLNPVHKSRTKAEQSKLTRDEASQQYLKGTRDVKDVMVLICGHGGRDQRCGVLGPILRDAFRKALPKEGIKVLHAPLGSRVRGLGTPKAGETARIGLISHIGGHKFAGNIILYIPPGMKTVGGQPHQLAGCGIWYGRVEAKHVEGIVKETVLGGKVIEDLFRGGIRQGGEILRL